MRLRCQARRLVDFRFEKRAERDYRESRWAGGLPAVASMRFRVTAGASCQAFARSLVVSVHRLADY
jgi:hypothetical protein